MTSADQALFIFILLYLLLGGIAASPAFVGVRETPKPQDRRPKGAREFGFLGFVGASRISHIFFLNGIQVAPRAIDQFPFAITLSELFAAMCSNR
jgi:hypothetical protein